MVAACKNKTSCAASLLTGLQEEENTYDKVMAGCHIHIGGKVSVAVPTAQEVDGTQGIRRNKERDTTWDGIEAM
jgi:hypothetical protein